MAHQKNSLFLAFTLIMCGCCFAVRAAEGEDEALIKATRSKATKGDATAQALLGISYLYGKCGIETNEIEAAKWLRKAAEQGNAEAQILLGTCFDDGKGVVGDYSEAAKW